MKIKSSNIIQFLISFFCIILISSCTSDKSSLIENKQMLYFGKKAVFKFLKIKKEQTLSEIAAEYNVQISDLLELNTLSSTAKLTPGQIIKIPVEIYTSVDDNEGYVYDPSPINTIKEEDSESSDEDSNKKNQKAVIFKESNPAIPTNLKKSEYEKDKFSSLTPIKSKLFVWPIEGKILLRYGDHNGKFNEGINIGAPLDTPIKASADGEVIYVGNQMQAYGNLIILKHKNDYMTAYAHNNKVMVKKGQHVNKGQTIATVGKTGNVKEPQLHFSIRKGKKTINPETSH